MVFYGYVRTTEDLDVAVNPACENLDRVADWLIGSEAIQKLKPARGSARPNAGPCTNGSNATVVTSLGQIDVVQRLPGLPDWPQLVEEAELYEVDGFRVPVMNRRTLIELKRRRGSHLDLGDIDAIELLDEL